ncbi:MAG: hypothetical protein EBX12_07635, partial [Actinobacteria bacterium]|nr:hypothetical protein [Actinomycetota bacterium]
MKRILYVPFDQLHRRYGILKSANPQEDLIVMFESKRMTTGDQWHKVRLYFLISSARHFAEELKTEGFTVHYVQAETTEIGLKKIQESENLPIYACEQSSYRALHHSLLSPYINNGLLHPSEVIAEALKRYKKGDIPIASCEGFIRQIIGWREYINGMYWFLGEEYKENNHLSANRKLLPLLTNSSSTKMNCVKNVISDIENRAWTHHIPRLMVLSNLALITGTNPQEFLDWMRRTFIDASDWVMVPNIIGMGLHADNGKMMTKPYAAGGAYISRMSNYCSQCSYDPKLRTGETACPFTTLYWDFLDR